MAEGWEQIMTHWFACPDATTSFLTMAPLRTDDYTVTSDISPDDVSADLKSLVHSAGQQRLKSIYQCSLILGASATGSTLSSTSSWFCPAAISLYGARYFHCGANGSYYGQRSKWSNCYASRFCHFYGKWRCLNILWRWHGFSFYAYLILSCRSYHEK